MYRLRPWGRRGRCLPSGWRRIDWFRPRRGNLTGRFLPVSRRTARVSESAPGWSRSDARGWTNGAAEIVLALRDEGAAVRLICASPYRGFESRWGRDWQERYRLVMERADLVRFICPAYSRDCFQRRNEWMVDHSARVIAVYNGEPGGTRNTVEYAQWHNVPVINIPLKVNSDVLVK